MSSRKIVIHTTAFHNLIRISGTEYDHRKAAVLMHNIVDCCFNKVCYNTQILNVYDKFFESNRFNSLREFFTTWMTDMINVKKFRHTDIEKIPFDTNEEDKIFFQTAYGTNEKVIITSDEQLLKKKEEYFNNHGIILLNLEEANDLVKIDVNEEINKEEALESIMKSLKNLKGSSKKINVDTGDDCMNRFIRVELRDIIGNILVPKKYIEDFFEVLNKLVGEMIKSHDNENILQKLAENWWEIHKDDAMKRMEVDFFQKQMHNILYDKFGKNIQDRPLEARGHIDLKLSTTIPIELKVLRDDTNAIKTSSIEELKKELKQMEAEMMNYPLGFLIGLDFRKKVKPEQTTMLNTEYIEFIFKEYKQSIRLIVLIIFLANKKTPSEL